MNVPNITSAYYLIQVYLCAFKAMMLLLENEETILDKWINEKAYECTMFYYCKMIFALQVLILQFVCSKRESNFNSYVVLKYVFALNHCNYAR